MGQDWKPVNNSNPNERENRDWRNRNPIKGVGDITWEADNLADQNFMEAVADLVDAAGTMKGAEFLRSLGNGDFRKKQQEKDKRIEELEEEVEKLKEAIGELEKEEDEPAFSASFRGIEEIYFKADNLLDVQLMEAFATWVEKQGVGPVLVQVQNKSLL